MVSSRYGTQTGTISATCVDVTEYHYVLQTNNYEDTGVDMLCQDQAGFTGRSGDSGAPVYGVPYTNYRRALGLFWGTALPAGYGDPNAPDASWISTYSPIGYVTGEIANAISPSAVVTVICTGLTNQAPGCPP